MDDNELHGEESLRSYVMQLVKKLPAFYRTRRLITVFTRAHHWSLLLAR